VNARVRRLRGVSLAGAILACCGGERDARTLERCLGPQDIVQEVEAGKAKEYELDLRVVSGARLRLEESPNPVITCKAGKLVAVKSDILPDRLYVIAKLRLRATTGWRVYDCRVRVTSGPLKGAVVTVCSAEFAPAPSISATYQACYELPAGLASEGALDHEIVQFTGK
jgi:hypothetical protein